MSWVGFGGILEVRDGFFYLDLNLDTVWNKVQWPYQNPDNNSNPQPETSSILQSLKSYLREIDGLCTFKIKIKSQSLEQGCTKDQSPYPNLDKDAKP